MARRKSTTGARARQGNEAGLGTAPPSPYHKEIFNQDKTYVFYCASAWRSALSAKVAQDMGLEPVAHIAGGFTAWLKADGPVEALPEK